MKQYTKITHNEMRIGRTVFWRPYKLYCSSLTYTGKISSFDAHRFSVDWKLKNGLRNFTGVYFYSEVANDDWTYMRFDEEMIIEAQEVPCSRCSRKNYTDAKCCWMCGNENFMRK